MDVRTATSGDQACRHVAGGPKTIAENNVELSGPASIVLDTPEALILRRFVMLRLRMDRVRAWVMVLVALRSP